MKVIFRYSEKIERQVIEYFHDNPDQRVNLVLPKDDKVNQPIDLFLIESILSEIKEDWLKIEGIFAKHVQNLNLNIQPEFICYLSLSRYGSSGFFLPPNQLVIRIATKIDLKETNINIAHELIHLILRYNKKDKKLDYIDREKQVDNFLTTKEFINLFPDYQKQEF